MHEIRTISMIPSELFDEICHHFNDFVQNFNSCTTFSVTCCQNTKIEMILKIVTKPCFSNCMKSFDSNQSEIWIALILPKICVGVTTSGKSYTLVRANFSQEFFFIEQLYLWVQLFKCSYHTNIFIQFEIITSSSNLVLKWRKIQYISVQRNV